MTGYVDDTKGITNDMQNPNPLTLNKLVQTMQADAQLWGDLLHTSGRALESPKCNYYVMYWEFNAAGLPSLKADITPQSDWNMEIVLTQSPCPTTQLTMHTKHWGAGSPRKEDSINKRWWSYVKPVMTMHASSPRAQYPGETTGRPTPYT
jgi:hypothetical protein